MTSHAANQIQLAAVIPVSKYKHVTNPNNGMRDQFLMNVTKEKITQINQKIIVEIFKVMFTSLPENVKRFEK